LHRGADYAAHRAVVIEIAGHERCARERRWHLNQLDIETLFAKKSLVKRRKCRQQSHVRRRQREANLLPSGLGKSCIRIKFSDSHNQCDN
jgi:hypothetical protein